MTDNPMERRPGDRPLETDVPAEEDVSEADAAERLEQDPEEVPNAGDDER